MTDADTAAALGSGSLPVLGTPRLLAWCEAATCAAIDPTLPAGSTSVGTRVELEHRAASPVGAEVQVTASASYVDGRLHRFTVARPPPSTAPQGRRHRRDHPRRRRLRAVPRPPLNVCRDSPVTLSALDVVRDRTHSSGTIPISCHSPVPWEDGRSDQEPSGGQPWARPGTSAGRARRRRPTTASAPTADVRRPDSSEPPTGCPVRGLVAAVEGLSPRASGWRPAGGGTRTFSRRASGADSVQERATIILIVRCTS